MKLLILTQKVDRNDPALGFFHRWVEKFSEQDEKIIVICLEKQSAGEISIIRNRLKDPVKPRFMKSIFSVGYDHHTFRI